MFREDSIIARAKQVLGLEDDLDRNVKRNFVSRINKYHPDRHGPTYTDRTKVLIEAYKVLSGRISPEDCKLLEDDDLVASLLPKGVKPVILGTKYECWVKDRFYDFVKPHEDMDRGKNRKVRIRRGF